MPSYYFMKKSEYREYLRCTASNLPFEYPDFVPLGEVSNEFAVFVKPVWPSSIPVMMFGLMCMTGWYALAARGGVILEHYHFTAYIDQIIDEDPIPHPAEKLFDKALYRKFMLEDYVFGGNG